MHKVNPTCELGWWMVATIVFPFPAISLLRKWNRIVEVCDISTLFCKGKRDLMCFKIIGITYVNTSMTFWAINESKPDVGSSQNMSGGLVKTSEAKERRFFSPPEIPLIVCWLLDEPTKVSRHFDKPNWNI